LRGRARRLGKKVSCSRFSLAGSENHPFPGCAGEWRHSGSNACAAFAGTQPVAAAATERAALQEHEELEKRLVVFPVPGSLQVLRDWARQRKDQTKGASMASKSKGKSKSKAKRKTKRKYSKSAGQDVKNEMHRYKRGKAKSGPGGKGGKVKSRKQAIAIGLSKARRKGKKVPKKKT
jgi:hypothetical protein